MLKEHEHMVYESDEGVPTIQLGCGGVNICDLHGRDAAGVAFMFNDGGEVGEHHENIAPGGTEGENKAFFRIVATKPESLQVLIDKLETAKNNFGNPKPPVI